MLVTVLLFAVVIVPVIGGFIAWWRRFDATLPRRNEDFGCW